ncbi:hypothetical protein TNCV_3034081, partial [Trichonephila clavipes]
FEIVSSSETMPEHSEATLSYCGLPPTSNDTPGKAYRCRPMIDYSPFLAGGSNSV